MDIIALGVSLLSGNGLKTAVGGDRDERGENGKAGRCVGMTDRISRPILTEFCNIRIVIVSFLR